MPAEFTLSLNTLALDALLHSEHGPIARNLERRAIKVQAAASQLCPVDTGRLRAAIDYALGEDSQGLFVDVGSNVEYCLAVEEGTVHQAAQPFLRPALSTAAA